MIRLIAVDFDDTLYTADKRVTEANRQALCAAMDRGIRVLPCSGRYEDCMMDGVRALNLDCEGEYLISSNGAKIVRLGMKPDASDADRIERLITTPPEHARQVIAWGRAHADCVNVQVYANNRFYVERYDRSTAFYESKAKRLATRIDSLDETLMQPIEKVIFTCEAAEPIRQLYDLFIDQIPAGLHMFKSAPYLLEFTNAAVDKWNAVCYLADKFGIAREEILCMGDYQNDVTMVGKAGFGGCPSNALDSVKAVADYVSPLDHEHDAVADILNHFAAQLG